MKIHFPNYCVLFMSALVLCLADMPHCGPVVAYAAKAPPVAAQKAPEAQKKPVARPQPVARPRVVPRKNPTAPVSVERSLQKQFAPAVVAPKQAPSGRQVAQTASPAVAPVDSAGDKLKTTLDGFAKDCIRRMNKERRPGINAKEVQRQSDGSYLARYMAVDPDSLETSYNPTENNKTVRYIGRMNYHEVEYISRGGDQKQALGGPFTENNRTPITELIKYKSGKWTY